MNACQQSKKPAKDILCRLSVKMYNPPSRVHRSENPAQARRYPHLCFVLPTSVTVVL